MQIPSTIPSPIFPDLDVDDDCPVVPFERYVVDTADDPVSLVRLIAPGPTWEP